MSPRRLDVQREPVGQVRLGAEASSALLLTNTRARRARLAPGRVAAVRRAHGERHRLRLPGGERRRFTTTLRPTRRGDRLADRVTVRSFGPLGIGAGNGR